MLIEIDYAYWKLSKEERKFLFLRYHENMEYEDIAIEMNSGKPDATRMRINRIIKKLISKLGGFTPYFDADSEPKENTDSPTSGDESD
jgi:DNA-directed RNA polymerase specialized sigma24 family protein